MKIEEYEQLDEVLGFRDELIEGERVLPPNAVFAHSVVIKELERILESELREMRPEPLQVVRTSQFGRFKTTLHRLILSHIWESLR